MTDRPVIFSAPMVRALLEGRKTMTRRLAYHERRTRNPAIAESPTFIAASPWQRVQPGDRLWVREACMSDPDRFTIYRADWERYNVCDTMRWRPSIHMPRWASRLTLTVTAVRVERLQEISTDDALAEGCGLRDGMHHLALRIAEFRDLWNSLHGPSAWDANPEVVALTFTVAKENIDHGR